MPKHKDLKRLVRSRQQKTGESYTAARAQILRKGRTEAQAKAMPRSAPGRDLGALAGMSDETVRAKTGRTWGDWEEVLDTAGAAAKPHREIAALVHTEHGVPGWWSQAVTVGYERIKGLREIGQRREGTWEVNRSKTVPVPVARLYRAFSVARQRRRWLAEPWDVRTATAGKSMRVRWADGSTVVVYFVDKGSAKSQVAIQHAKLLSRAGADELKPWWSERLEELARLLAPAAGRSATAHPGSG